MQRLALIFLPLLAACQDKGPDDKAVLAEANKMTRPLPGLYRSTTTLTSYDLPGADPETADVMRDRFAQVLPQRREFCVTPEAAARGFQDMLKQSQQGDCRVDRFEADKARLNARMSCRLGPKLTSTITLEGTGAADRSQIDLRIVQRGPSVPGGSETIAMHVDNVRVGDCPR